MVCRCFWRTCSWNGMADQPCAIPEKSAFTNFCFEFFLDMVVARWYSTNFNWKHQNWKHRKSYKFYHSKCSTQRYRQIQAQGDQSQWQRWRDHWFDCFGTSEPTKGTTRSGQSTREWLQIEMEETRRWWRCSDQRIRNRKDGHSHWQMGSCW